MYVLVCEECEYVSEYDSLESGVTKCFRCQSIDLDILEYIDEE